MPKFTPSSRRQNRLAPAPPAETEWLVFAPLPDDQARLGSVMAANCDEASIAVSKKWPGFAAFVRIIPAEHFARMQARLERRVEADPEPYAFHEAGHAAVARSFGWEVASISIRPQAYSAGGWFSPDRDSLGCTALAAAPNESRRYDDGPEGEEQFMIYALAGPAAEYRFRPGRTRWRDINDMVAIEKLLDGREEGERTAYVKDLKARARQAVNRCWREIESIARALAERRELTGEEIDRLLSDPPRLGMSVR